MTHHDSQHPTDADREALATLVARFSADRDALAAAVQRAEAGIREIAARLDAVAARANDALPANELGPMRFELGRLESLVESATDELRRLQSGAEARGGQGAAGNVVVGDAGELRAELQRVAGEVAERAAETHAALARALDEVRCTAVSSGERATQALSHAADLERRGRDLESLRPAMGQVRDEFLRRIDETEARLGVRLDSILAGVEAETRSVRDSMWDKLSNMDQRLREAEQGLVSVRVGLPQSVTRALEGMAALHGEVEQLRQRLDGASDRLGTLEQQRQPRGLLECVRDEIVAAVMTVVSVGAVFGRLALSLVR